MVRATRSGDAATIEAIRARLETPSLDREILLSAISRDERVLRDALESADWPQEDLDVAARTAMRTGHADAVRLQVELGADLATDEFAMLWEAAERADPELVRLAIEHGADVNREHNVAKGWSPLRRSVVGAASRASSSFSKPAATSA